MPRLGLRSTTSGCGSRRRCAGWSAATLTRRRPRPRACTPATASGVVPSTSASCASCSTASRTPRPARSCCPSCTSTIPADRLAEAAATRRPSSPIRSAEASRSSGSTRPMVDDPVEQLLARTWRPTLSVRRRRRLPADRPGRQRAAPVDRRCSSASASRRRAIPTRPRRRARARRSPPTRRTGATVTLRATSAAAPGWNAPAFAPWLRGGARRRVDGRLRQPGAGVRRGRHDPVHGHARRRCSPTPSSSITGVLGARQQRPRPQRVPPPPDGAAHQRVHRPSARRPRPILTAAATSLGQPPRTMH